MCSHAVGRALVPFGCAVVPNLYMGPFLVIGLHSFCGGVQGVKFLLAMLSSDALATKCGDFSMLAELLGPICPHCKDVTATLPGTVGEMHVWHHATRPLC